MKIAKGKVVSVVYQARIDGEILIEEFTRGAPLVYLHGQDDMVIGLEKALTGCTVGHHFNIVVEPNDAYGEFDDHLVQRIPKTLFNDIGEVQVGMRFWAETERGILPVEITEVEQEHVIVDGNHPLVGQKIHFQGEVVAISEAAPDELAEGNIYSSDCCSKKMVSDEGACDHQQGSTKQKGCCHAGKKDACRHKCDHD